LTRDIFIFMYEGALDFKQCTEEQFPFGVLVEVQAARKLVGMYAVIVAA